MVDINSGRYMQDVGAVAVQAKDHEVAPGVKEAMAKGQAPGVNSSFQLNGAQEVTVGADGKGVVTATVVAQKPGQEADKPAPAKGAKPAVPESSGAINNRPVAGVTAAAPAVAVGAPQPAAQIGRGPGTAVAARQANAPAVRATPVAITPPAQQGALAVKAREDGPKAKGPKNTGPKPDAGGQLEVKQVAVTVDLKETRREKILAVMGGGAEGPQQNALAGRHRDYAGAKPVMGGAESATVNALADKGPQIEVPGAAPKATPEAAPQIATPKVAPNAKPQYAGVIAAPNPLRTN